MLDKKKRNTKLSNMTDEEKLEHKRKQMREYMAKRKESDPEFANKQKEYVKKNNQTKYLDKRREYNKTYYERKKNSINELKEKVANLTELIKN